jgi:hypothetical protein
MNVTYTTKQMVAASKIHQSNNYNLLKTSRESGVPRNSLRRWIDSMGSQVFKPNLLQELSFKAGVMEQDRRTKLAGAVLNRQMEIVDCIGERFGKTKSLYELARSLKILHDIERDNQSLTPDSSGENSGPYVLI